MIKLQHHVLQKPVKVQTDEGDSHPIQTSEISIPGLTPAKTSPVLSRFTSKSGSASVFCDADSN